MYIKYPQSVKNFCHSKNTNGKVCYTYSFIHRVLIFHWHCHLESKQHPYSHRTLTQSWFKGEVVDVIATLLFKLSYMQIKVCVIPTWNQCFGLCTFILFPEWFLSVSFGFFSIFLNYKDTVIKNIHFSQVCFHIAKENTQVNVIMK